MTYVIAHYLIKQFAWLMSIPYSVFWMTMNGLGFMSNHTMFNYFKLWLFITRSH